jgi:hypothetical protein
MRFIQSPQFVEIFELMGANTPVNLVLGVYNTPIFKTGAVVQAWLPRLRIFTVGNAF